MSGDSTVERLMSVLKIQGARRGKAFKTTVPDENAARPADLVERAFAATRPNQLWVADITFVATWRGFVFVAFVVDVFARRIVGWRVSTSIKGFYPDLQSPFKEPVDPQISFLLGFKDPNSFFRAFHTWSGSTPDSVRNEALH